MLLKTFLRLLSRSSRNNTPRALPRRPLLLEQLEERDMPSAYIVTNLTDSSNYQAGDGSLRGEIAQAMQANQANAVIQFSSNLQGGTINLTAGELLISQSLTISGLTNAKGGPALTISGNSTSRIFDIEASYNPLNVTLQNLTITNGLAAQGAPNIQNAGGGILISDVPGGTVTLSNLDIVGNTAEGYNGNTGATDQQGQDGQQALGGGIAFIGGATTQLVINNTSFFGNTALGGQGGQGGYGGTLTHYGAAGVGGQGGDAVGGGIYAVGGNLQLSNDSLSANEARAGSGGVGGQGGVGPNYTNLQGGAGGQGGFAQGGGLYVTSNGTVQLSNDTISLNTATGGQAGTGGAAGTGGSGFGTVGAAGSAGQAEGGGLDVSGGLSFQFTGGTVTSNQATGGNGAAGLLDPAANGSAGAAATGGGLYFAGSSAALSQVTFSTNQATGGAGGVGAAGAILTEPNNSAVTATFQAGAGGAGGNSTGGGITVAHGTVTLGSDTFTSNVALGGAGALGGNGASGTIGSSGIPGNNGTANGNGASGGAGSQGNAGLAGGAGGNGGSATGGGLYASGGSLQLTDTTWVSNSAEGGVGGQGGGGGQGGPGGNGANGNDLPGPPFNANYGGNGGIGGNGGYGGNGGAAGAGGNAEAGALYVGAGVTVTSSGDAFKLNQADGGSGDVGGTGGVGAYGGQGGYGGTGDFGGEGAVGGNGGSAGTGGPSGNGGFGEGGAIFVASGGTISLSNDTLGGNDALGGTGGRGGTGGNSGSGGYGGWGGDGSLNDGVHAEGGSGGYGGLAAAGGAGGLAGNGGLGAGGALFVAAGATTSSTSDTYNSNMASGGAGGTGGQGGSGGQGGFGGAGRHGDLLAGPAGAGTAGGTGGTSTAGGVGGNGEGGALYISGVFTTSGDILTANTAQGGNGGGGGYGGPAGAAGVAGGAGASVNTGANGGQGGAGGNGGTGGNGGQGGNALGGGAYLALASNVAFAQVSGNSALAGTGGRGGDGGTGQGGAVGSNGGGGSSYSQPGYGGTARAGAGGNGGNGGNAGSGGQGGNAQGGGLFVLSGTVTLNDVPLSNNQAQAGAGGAGGNGGAGNNAAQAGVGAFPNSGGSGGTAGVGGNGGLGGNAQGGLLDLASGSAQVVGSTLSYETAQGGAGGNGGLGGVGGNGATGTANSGTGGNGGGAGNGGTGGQAGNGGTGSGGAVYADGTSLVFTTTTFTSDTAAGGNGGTGGNGGIAGGGGTGGDGSSSDNGGTGGSGGGGGSGGAGGNAGAGFGGGLVIAAGNVQVEDSVFNNNLGMGGNGGLGGNGAAGGAGGVGGNAGSGTTEDSAGNGGSGGGGGNGGPGGSGANAQGAGFYLQSGSLLLVSTTVADNTATPGTGATGGSGAAGGAGGAAGNTGIVFGGSNPGHAGGNAGGGSGGATGNPGLAEGGGAFINSQANFINDTFSANTASSNTNDLGSAGGLFVGSSATLEANNSIFSGNMAANAPDFYGVVMYSNDNLVGNTSGASGFSANTGDILNVKANLEPLGNYGGPTQTMPLLPGSPGINAGSSAVTVSQENSGLLSAWQGDGNALDSTGLNNLTAVGGVTYAQGVAGEAFQLNGSTAYLTTAANPTSLSINTALTVSALVDPSVEKSDNVIIDKTQSGDAANYRFGIHGNGELFFYNGSTAVFSNAIIPVNTWSMVAFTLNAATNTLSFYVNGQLDSTHSIGFGALNTAAVTLGRDSDGRFFQGLLENVTLFKAALTPAQVGLLARLPLAATGSAPTSIPGLISSYAGQGNGLDSTGQYNLTAVGGVTYAPGVSGDAFQLDGSTSYLTTAANPVNLSINNVITVSAWVDPTVEKSDNVIIDKTQSGDAANYRFGIHGNGELFFWNGFNAVFSNAVIPVNTWTQVAFTLNAATNILAFYVNGELDSTHSISFGALNTAAVTIGRDIEGRSFQGLLDNVNVYHQALSATQVAALYENPIGLANDQGGFATSVGNQVSLGASEYQYDLAITGSTSGVFGANNTITYKLTVTNNGPDAVAGVTLTDPLPSTVNFQSLTAPTGWTVTAPAVGTTGTVTATDGTTLAPGASVTFTLVVQANITTEGTVINNTISVGPQTEDTVAGNNSVTLTSMAPVMVSVGVDIHGQPVNALVGQSIGKVTVAVVDANGNTLPHSNQLVTLAIDSGPKGAILGGTTTVRAVNGVATFTNLSFNLEGTYTLMATGGKLTPDYSNSFTITPANVTSKVKVSTTLDENWQNQMYILTVTITNTTRQALTGPLALVLTNLPSHYVLLTDSGTYQGQSYVTVLDMDSSLAAGKSLRVMLVFQATASESGNNDKLTFTPELVEGLTP